MRSRRSRRWAVPAATTISRGRASRHVSGQALAIDGGGSAVILN
jgi:hypothetical protein